MLFRYRFEYFGYRVEFTSEPKPAAELRAEANRLVIERYGETPALSYYEPGVPFPSFVHGDRYEPPNPDENEPGGWYGLEAYYPDVAA